MDFATARRKMVDNQVRPNDVTELRLIAAMLEVPRERYVSAARQAMAYTDGNLPLGPAGRVLLKPMVLAKLIQAAEVSETDHVLDVACGTGYSTAILAKLAEKVVALEEDKALADEAYRRLTDAAATNATVVRAPVATGWPNEAPYDVILVNGAVELAPDALLNQLKEGGRLLAIVASGPVGKATLFQRIGSDVSARPLFDAVAPVLPSFVKPPEFVF